VLKQFGGWGAVRATGDGYVVGQVVVSFGLSARRLASDLKHRIPVGDGFELFERATNSHRDVRPTTWGDPNIASQNRNRRASEFARPPSYISRARSTCGPETQRSRS
jgi:hypothetical protein